MKLELDLKFDNDTYRRTMNGHQYVWHCHHYMSLTTKLAESFADLGAVRVLREATEDSIRPLLDDYFRQHGVSDLEDRMEVGMEYYRIMGLGSMVVRGDAGGGQVELAHSHVDEGWVKKWGKHDKPINHVSCGYVAALFAAACDKPPRSFEVTETESIVMGAPHSVLAVKPA